MKETSIRLIDLHVHSTASDGTYAPEALAEQGRSFALMALTDHDTCGGTQAFLDASRQLGVTAPRWAGVELSVEPGAGYGKFHLLGLGINPAAPSLTTFLADILDGRNARNVVILQKLQNLGLHIELADAQKFSDGRILARPHFARALVEKGYAASVLDAFGRFLGDGKPAYVDRYRPTPEAAIAAIHRAGGLAVMAHPRYWTSDPAALRTGLARLKDVGLDGVEAVYEANQLGETVDHLMAAHALGLLVTAGSDFHGANKPTISLGMDVGDEEAFIAPLLARHAELQTVAEC